jgi:hypothetical protein
MKAKAHRRETGRGVISRVTRAIFACFLLPAIDIRAAVRVNAGKKDYSGRIMTARWLGLGTLVVALGALQCDGDADDAATGGPAAVTAASSGGTGGAGGSTTATGAGGGGPEDSDGDGVPDALDACPGGDDGLDADRDRVPDPCDDSDGDGFCVAGSDEDGDGDCTSGDEPEGPSDCNDEAPNAYPAALERYCVDQLDNDCDDLSDADDDQCTQDIDFDTDGYCPLGRDLNDNGACLDAGEDEAVGDCDDGNALVNPDDVEVCDDEIDNDCDGLTDSDDSDC